MTKRILITGAQGFLGRYLVASWLGADPGVEIVGAGRSPRRRDRFTHSVTWGSTLVPAPLTAELAAAERSDRYRYVPLDLLARPALTGLLQELRPDVIVHLAGELRDSAPERLLQGNVGATISLLESIAGAGIAAPRLVLGSTGAVYGVPAPGALPLSEEQAWAPSDLYAISKRAAEDAARVLAARHGIPVTWARIFNPVGPGQDERHLSGRIAAQVAAAAAGEIDPVIEVGPLDRTRDFIDARDVARALVLLAERGEPGAAYNVASGVETPAEEVLRAALRAAGLEEAARIDRRPGRAGDPLRHVADVRRLRALGFTPRHSLGASLADLHAYYMGPVARAARAARGEAGSTFGAPGRLAAPSAPNPGSTFGAPGRLAAPSAPNPGSTFGAPDRLAAPSAPNPGPAAPSPEAELTVEIASRHCYPVALEPGLLRALPARLRALFPAARLVVLDDERVHALHGARAVDALRAAGFAADAISIPADESSKSLERARDVIERLHALRFDRRSVLVNLGGGLVSDLGGFVASVYMRGVAYVNVPTTLLAQHDSAIGGKVAVNTPWAKNFVGAFHHPRAVFCDPEVLATLDDRNLAAGIAEAIKVAIIDEPALFDLLERRAGAVRARDAGVLGEIVRRAARKKIEILGADPYEIDLRRTLNLGHTFAHPLEVELGYAGLLHGEAVAFGLAVATFVALARGVCARRDAARITALLRAYALPPPAPRSRLEAARRRLDEIRLVRAGRLNYVLPERVGAVRIVDEVAGDELGAAIAAIAADPEIGACVRPE